MCVCWITGCNLNFPHRLLNHRLKHRHFSCLNVQIAELLEAAAADRAALHQRVAAMEQKSSLCKVRACVCVCVCVCVWSFELVTCW